MASAQGAHVSICRAMDEPAADSFHRGLDSLIELRLREALAAPEPDAAALDPDPWDGGTTVSPVLDSQPVMPLLWRGDQA